MMFRDNFSDILNDIYQCITKYLVYGSSVNSCFTVKVKYN